MNKSFMEKEFLHQVTIRICGTLDLFWGLKRSLDYLKKFIPMDALILYWEDPEKEEIRIVADTGKKDSIINQKVSKIPDYAIDSIKKVKDQTHAKIYNYDDTDETYIYMIKEAGYEGRSVLVGRLRKDGRHIGGIAAVAHPGEKYNEVHENLFNIISDPFTMALANYKWHEQIVKLRESLFDQKAFFTKKLRSKRCHEIVGADSGMKEVMGFIEQVAPVNTPVLILGETGVGKEVVANEIHHLSGRYDKPFVKVNCGAISDSLIESELFGHEKGSFTGALSRKTGFFERADGGTIFLDEIGELPIEAQVKLLRVLQNNEIVRVGGNKVIQVDVRVIAATNRSVEDMVEEGSFRRDLWYRINVFQINIPPLRDRINDLPELVHYFVNKKVSELKITGKIQIIPEEIEKLKNYQWRGNIRELENIIERALIRHTKGPLTFNLPEVKGCFENRRNNPETLDSVVKNHISKVLKLSRGKINGPKGAAQILKINPSTLRGKIKKLSIDI